MGLEIPVTLWHHLLPQDDDDNEIIIGGSSHHGVQRVPMYVLVGFPRRIVKVQIRARQKVMEIIMTKYLAI